MYENEIYKKQLQQQMYAIDNDVLNIRNPAQQDSLKWRLDPSPDLDRLEHYFNGEIYDPKTDSFIKNPNRNIKPLMTDEGVYHVIALLRGHLTTAIVQGNTSAIEVATLVFEVSEVIRDFLFFNYEKYEIFPENFSLIMITIEHQIEIFLSRTKNDLERKHSWGSHKFIEHHNQEPTQNKKGFKIFGW